MLPPEALLENELGDTLGVSVKVSMAYARVVIDDMQLDRSRPAGAVRNNSADIDAQASQIFRNVGAVLEAARRSATERRACMVL